jgi:hypothetical protein
MATLYTNEVTVGSTISAYASAPWIPTNTPLSAALTFEASLSAGTLNDNARLVFNDTTNPLTTAAPYVATFANTAGTSVSSGTGSVTYNRSLSSQPIYIVMPDRTSFAGTLPATTGSMTLTNNGFEAWGQNERRLRLLGYF